MDLFNRKKLKEQEITIALLKEETEQAGKQTKQIISSSIKLNNEISEYLKPVYEGKYFKISLSLNTFKYIEVIKFNFTGGVARINYRNKDGELGFFNCDLRQLKSMKKITKKQFLTEGGNN